MKKIIFNWDLSTNKKYKGRQCPSFDFVAACVKDIVIWWDENQFCIDMDRINEVKKTCKEGIKMKQCPCCEGSGYTNENGYEQTCGCCGGLGTVII